MKVPYKHVGTAILFALALGVSSCNGYTTQAYAPVAATGVKVTPQSVQIAAIGGTTQLVAAVAPLDASDRAVTWESTDPSIATVDAAGRVTAHAVGAGVLITAITHDGHFQSSANVSVGQ
ncbi:MAG: Ig-like domain-containing protein [Gemmatimonadaceae bacterium]